MGLKFDNPAVYKISIKGQLPDSWSSRLAGLTISRREEDRIPITVLHGSLLDQADLMGVLQSLYSLHLPLISVKYVGEIETKGDK